MDFEGQYNIPEEVILEMILDRNPSVPNRLVLLHISQFRHGLLRNVFANAHLFKSILSDLQHYLSKNELLSCKLVCRGWNKTVTEVTEVVLKKFDDDDASVIEDNQPLHSRLIPTLALPDNASGFLPGLSTDMKKCAQNRENNYLLGSSLSLAAPPGAHEDFITSMTTDFIKCHGSKILHFSLRIEADSLRSIRQKCWTYLNCLPNLRKFELIADMTTEFNNDFNRRSIQEQNIYPDPLTLPFLKIVIFNAKFLCRYNINIILAMGLMGKSLVDLFINQSSQIRILKATDPNLTNYIQPRQPHFTCLSEVSFVVTSSWMFFGRESSSHYIKIKKLTLLFLWIEEYYNFKRNGRSQYKEMVPSKLVEILAELIVFKEMQILEINYDRELHCRWDIFPSCNMPLSLPQLTTLSIRNGYICSDFGALRSLEKLKRLHLSYDDEDDVPGGVNLPAMDSIWKSIRSLDILTIQKLNHPRQFLSRELQQFSATVK